MSETKTLRVFISSPGDVRPERLIAARVVERLDREFQHYCRLEQVLWERKPLKATLHFQHPDNIPAPRTTDVAVVILWSRLGVPLPASAFVGAKTGRTVTGTEWEFEDALKASEDHGTPDLLVYRKTAPALAGAVGDEAEERSRQKRLLDDFISRWFVNAEDGTFRAASHTFADPAEFEETLYTHLRAKVLERLGNPDDLYTVRWHQGSPFRGLESFGPEHAQVFFGRRRARNELREALTAQMEAGRPILLVIGASGSGKSSLVKAGLLPDLMLPGMLSNVGLVRWAVMRPGDRGGDPMGALAAALLAPTALPALPLGPEALAASAPDAVAATVAGALASAASIAELAQPWRPKLVLVVDQLEELFADTVTAAARAAFTATLETLALRGDAVVVATLRSDFFPVMEELPGLAALTTGAGRVLLFPPDDTEIGEIILGPAQEAGLSFEPHPEDGRPLNETLRHDAAGEPGVLPLMEFTLDQLWRRREGAQLTYAAYQDLGGLKGAIGRRAEAIVAAQPREVQAALPRLLFALARAEQGEAGRILARAVSLPASVPEHHLAQALLAPDARLLVADEDGMLRVAHEALLTHWTRARDILERSRADLQLRERITQAATEWARETGRHKTGLLLRQPLLAQARDLIERRRGELDPALYAYVEESARWDRRQMQRLRIAAAAFAVLAIGAAVAAWFGFAGQNEAIRQAEEAMRQTKVARQQEAEKKEQLSRAQKSQSQFLAEKAGTFLEQNDPEKALLTVLEGLPRNPANREPSDRPLVTEASRRAVEAMAAQRQRQVLTGHTGWVSSAAFSPTGDRVVTASWDNSARVWDVGTGAEIAVLKGHKFRVETATFSPSGDRIVTASYDRTARVWDAHTGTEIAVLKDKYQEGVNTATFSPTGDRVVTASNDKTARIWDASTGAEIAVLKGHQDTVYTAAFSPTGDLVVTASYDGTARVWDVNPATEIAVLRHQGAVLSAAFSPTGDRVVTSSGDTAHVWDARTGAEIAVLRGHQAAITSAAFSPSGDRVVTASNDSTARLWDARTGTEIAVLKGHQSFVRSATFSPSGDRILTASWDETAWIWDARTGAEIAVLKGHKGLVNSAVFSPTGDRVVTASNDRTARTWDVNPATEIASLRHQGVVFSAVFSPSGDRVVTASHDNTARVWDSRTSAQIFLLTGHAGEVVSAAFSPSGDLVGTASADKTARIWDARTGATVAVLKGHEGLVSSIAFSSHGDRVVTASYDGSARIWDTHTGAQIFMLWNGKLRYDLSNAVFSPLGDRVVTVSDETARLWDARTGAEIAVLGGRSYIFTAAFSPSGDQIVTAAMDLGARVFDARTGAKIAELKHWDEKLHFGVGSAAFSPSGDRVVTASSDKIARIWDARTGAELVVLRGHQGEVRSASFSPSGDRVVTASDDKTARLWDARTGAEIAIFKGHQEAVRFASFSPSGDRVVTASDDNTARLWAPRAAPLEIEAARLAATRVLTPEERQALFLDDSLRQIAAPSIAPCDSFAAHPFDPRRVGPGVVTEELDADNAVSACREAVAQSPLEPRFHYQLGRALEKKGQSDAAIAEYRQAAGTGYGAAWNNLAMALSKDPSPDWTQVLVNYRRAMESGFFSAAFPLASMYWNGNGVAQDRAEALRLANQGAAQGDPFSHVSLALHYEQGDGVAKDEGNALIHHAIAATLFAKAGDTKNTAEQTALTETYWSKSGAARARIEVLRLWQACAERGSPYCHARLARVWERGEGVAEELKQALFHHAIAARLYAEAGYGRNEEIETSRRGSLVRNLTPAEVATVWSEILAWKPKR